VRERGEGGRDWREVWRDRGAEYPPLAAGALRLSSTDSSPASELSCRLPNTGLKLALEPLEP
jgi:hypothetical protein